MIEAASETCDRLSDLLAPAKLENMLQQVNGI